MTDVEVPDYVTDTLSLGEKFIFTTNIRKYDYFEILKCIETPLNGIYIYIQIQHNSKKRNGIKKYVSTVFISHFRLCNNLYTMQQPN